MSIRGIDNHMILPRNVDFAKDAANNVNKGPLAQQFSVHLTEKEAEHKMQAPNEVMKGKHTNIVDEDGQGSHQEQQEQEENQPQEKKQPDEFSLTSVMIDIRI